MADGLAAVFFAEVVFMSVARSSVISVAGLSSRRPWNTACRTEPSLVISAKATSASRVGLSQCTPLTSAPLGGLTTAGFFVCKGLSCAWMVLNVASVKPVPTLPA
ncbi:hypothetical protein D3C71_1804720 [compost metagenome]